MRRWSPSPDVGIPVIRIGLVVYSAGAAVGGLGRLFETLVLGGQCFA
jgi:hypothetical protein